jgi:hypothetical protein
VNVGDGKEVNYISSEKFSAICISFCHDWCHFQNSSTIHLEWCCYVLFNVLNNSKFWEWEKHSGYNSKQMLQAKLCLHQLLLSGLNFLLSALIDLWCHWQKSWLSTTMALTYALSCLLWKSHIT